MSEALTSLPELAEEANRNHALAESTAARAIEYARKSGEALNEAKSQVKHGEWMAWVQANFTGKRQTSQNYMMLAANYQRIGNLEPKSINEALRMIAGEPDEEEPEPELELPEAEPVLHEDFTEIPAEEEPPTVHIEVVEQDEEPAAQLPDATGSRFKNEARTPTAGDGIFTDLSALLATGQKFGTIYADPPWRYSNQGTRGSTDNHYDGDLSMEELEAMPIGDLAADKCHLHLWTTNAFLFECPRLFKAWGFEFKSSFVWVKPQMGMGNYWRNSHEIMLLAIRGGQTALNKGQMSWLECKRGMHSAKPEEVRQRIEKLSPGPCLELFGRSPRTGWTVFGNQIVEELVKL